jgi:hypothetical protein
MSKVIGVAWFNDELTYRKALSIFTDAQNMPATFEDWKALVQRQCKEIRGTGNVALRVDIDPEAFADWCHSHGFLADSKGRVAFANHVELEYQITGKGRVIEYSSQ